MGLDLSLQKLSCTGCGAPLQLTPASRAKMVVCGACGSQIDLTKATHDVIGQVDKRRKAYPGSMIRLGKQATFDGVKHLVIGRIRYVDDEGYFWDEWLLLSEKGKYRWLAEDGFHFYFYELVRPENPIDPKSVYQGRSLEVAGRSYTAYEKAQAKIQFVEGELTWKAVLDEKVWYLDGACPPRKLSIEWNEVEIQVYEGPYMFAQDVYDAFGFTAAPPRPSSISPCQPYVMTPFQSFAVDACLLASVLAVLSIFAVGSDGDQVLRETYTYAQLQGKPTTKVFEIKEPSTVCEATFASGLSDGWGWIGCDVVDDKGATHVSFSEQLQYSNQYHPSVRRRSGEVLFRLDKAGQYQLKLDGQCDKKVSENKVAVILRAGYVATGYLWFFLFMALFYPIFKWLDQLWFKARRRAAMHDD